MTVLLCFNLSKSNFCYLFVNKILYWLFNFMRAFSNLFLKGLKLEIVFFYQPTEIQINNLNTFFDKAEAGRSACASYHMSEFSNAKCKSQTGPKSLKAQVSIIDLLQHACNNKFHLISQYPPGWRNSLLCTQVHIYLKFNSLRGY